MTTEMKQTVIKNPSWWRKRTSLEKYLTLTATIVAILAIALVIALGFILYQTNQKSDDSPYGYEALHSNHEPSVVSAASFPTYYDGPDKICLEPGCIHTASKVLMAMDNTIDPCQDFYQFACGNFIKNTNIPDDKSAVTSFSIISDTLQEQLRTMVEEPIRDNELKPFLLMKKLYQACMNKTAIEKEGLIVVKTILKNVGGWPVIEGNFWNEQTFDWKQLVYKFRKAGYSIDYFIDFSVGIDLKNSTKRIIDLDQPALGLRREFLIKGLEDRLVRAYYNYMVDIAVMFGAEKEVAQKELQDSLNFEIKLANISLPPEKRRNATSLYNPMTISMLQNKYPDVPWLEYINTVMDLPDIKATEDEVIIVSIPQYITDFLQLIKTTPKRVQANYAMWRAAASSVAYLNEDMRRRQLEYSTTLTGRTERESRWKECVDISTGSLSIAAGALYVRKYFNEDAKKAALDMVNEIRSEFYDILKDVDWMDENTKQNALDKAKSMTSHIAYPDELLDNNKILQFYEGLEVDSNQYLKSVINITLFGTAYSFRRLRQPVNKTDWITHGRPAIVNAFYSSIENSIQFPAGILQGVFFSKDRPRYMNYGAIGFVIGHEITHGFDDQGRQFDKNGNLVDWWDPETQKAFIKKAQCIIDQYGNYSVPELKLNLNGINTQGENIADNGGIKEAYLAYQSWAQIRETEPKLPGLDYTPNQMFWISAANTWCSKYRPETLKLRILTGQHSPGYFRVIGPLSNNENFANDFNCPSGSKMNPVKKCSVW